MLSRMEEDDDIASALVADAGAITQTSLAPDARIPADTNFDDSDDDSIIADLQASANRQAARSKSKGNSKGGGFQTFGLNAHLLKAITRKGFTVPTPIQRKTIPLILDRQDVVGMARTGSGKTAAFVLPMIERLKTHSPKIGIRALIMSPSRELALQTLKVSKEFGRGTDLRTTLLVGGDSLEEQFEAIASNPDIVIATPGRFLHVQVEMGLSLSSVQYVVFDEADRLFEMGFAAQLAEVLHALPASRQTLLFSATLPKSLVEFARAGLQEPHLVRLDAESKISQDLQNAFFAVKSAEKEGALLHILQDVIQMPTGETGVAPTTKSDGQAAGKKRKREEYKGGNAGESPTKHSTIVFVATKHHVEYVATLLRHSGYAVSHAYGALDQTARQIQVQNFRSGRSNILVVTDVAARGIDIPVLANVINYDFPAQPKIFVHRVGRTARAGQKGWSYSLVRDSDVPYLLDLQLFLSKKLVVGQADKTGPDFANDVVVGTLMKNKVEQNCEWVNKVIDEDSELAALQSVASKGERLYLKSRNSASLESARRSRPITSSAEWTNLHPLFTESTDNQNRQLEDMLARVSGFKPPETIFEIGRRGTGGEAAEIMKKRRTTLNAARQKRSQLEQASAGLVDEHGESDSQPTGARTTAGETDASEPLSDNELPALDLDVSSASSDELEVTVSDTTNPKKGSKSDFKDGAFFMSYQPTGTNAAEERAYGVHGGSSAHDRNFITAARSATMDLTNDEGAQGLAEPTSMARMRWDKKAKKYVARANDEDGSKGVKYIRGESGQKIAASFRSGRFDAWKRANRVKGAPRVGENESPATAGRAQSQQFGGGNRKWRHKKDEAPKDADKFRDDFHKRKKRVDEAKEARRGKYREGSGKNEIKTADTVRKERKAKEKLKLKNGRGKKKSKS